MDAWPTFDELESELKEVLEPPLDFEGPFRVVAFDVIDDVVLGHHAFFDHVRVLDLDLHAAQLLVDWLIRQLARQQRVSSAQSTHAFVVVVLGLFERLDQVLLGFLGVRSLGSGHVLQYLYIS